jgi:hypothetical protein
MSELLRWSCVLLLALVASCGGGREGDVPLRVVNPPTCPPGQAPERHVVIRLESGNDFVQQGLDHRMSAANTWAGRRATVAVGLCPSASPCQIVSWLGRLETTIGGSDRGLSVEIPPVQVRCDGGDFATNS